MKTNCLEKGCNVVTFMPILAIGLLNQQNNILNVHNSYNISVLQKLTRLPINKKVLSIMLSLLFSCLLGKAQINWKIQGGISYIEHFSAGIEMGFREKHSLAILYGSDFLIQPLKFSSCMLQYERRFPRMKFGQVTPMTGIKSGYSLYTNQYYQWKLLTVVPYMGLERSISKKWSLAMDLGMVFSRTLSMKRLNYGEVGWYKEYLPEIKLAVSYSL